MTFIKSLIEKFWFLLVSYKKSEANIHSQSIYGNHNTMNIAINQNFPPNSQELPNTNKDNLSSSLSDVIYNVSAGVGNAKCPFKTEGLKWLTLPSSPDLPNIRKEWIRSLIHDAQICSSGSYNRSLRPGEVKERFKILKAAIEEVQTALEK